MNETNPKNIVDINGGKRAELALDVVSDVLKNREKSAMDNLFRIFNEGETDAKPYLASVSKLVCYHELKRDLDQLIKKGRNAAEREYNQ